MLGQWPCTLVSTVWFASTFQNMGAANLAAAVLVWLALI